MTGTILNDDLIGNSRANILTGSARSEFIDGRGGRDRLTGGLGPDVFAFRFRESTLALPDRITDFEIGMDKIDIFSARGVDLPQPVAFSRAADNSTAATLNQLSTAVFSDANGALPGSQRLAANAAALVVATNPAIQGTYLVINDSTLRSETGNDMLINITGYTGVLPALGVIQSSDIFM